MSQIANPNFENAQGGLVHMGFQIFQDHHMPEHLGVFTKGQTLINGVRQVNAVGTIDWRTGVVKMTKGSQADSLYVHPTRYEKIRAELSKKYASQLLGKKLEAARKTAHD